MKYLKYIRNYFFVMTTILPVAVRADLPPGNPITFNIITDISRTLLNFLIGISMTAMVASIVISGIMVTTAGAEGKRYEKGIGMLKNAVIGSAIILGTGVILNTVLAVVTRDFFCQFSILGICIIN